MRLLRRATGGRSARDYRVLGAESAGEVLTIQRAAFLAEARLYGTVDLPPHVETLAQVRQELETAITIGAIDRGRLVGAIRLTMDGDVGWISRVTVAPDRQGEGIGSELLKAAKAAAPPEVTRFRLAVGDKSSSNISMYVRRGYREVGRSVDAAGVNLVILERERS